MKIHEPKPYDMVSDLSSDEGSSLLNSMRYIFPIERSEILDSQLWRWTPEESDVYLDIEGKSPLITNHLSDVTYKIQGGDGMILTASSQVRLQSGTEVTIFKGHPYSYEGEFDTIARARPGLKGNFVTFNNHELGKSQVQELKRLHGEYSKYRGVIAKLLNLALDAMELTNPNANKNYL